MEKEQKPNEQQTSAKPTNLEHKTAQAEERMFQLNDLPRLTWKLSDESERDVWSSEASDFQTYVQQFGSVDNVDTAVWDVFDRLDYVNELYAYCQINGFQFPFRVKPASGAREASG
jgi:hypothetical protein